MSLGSSFFILSTITERRFLSCSGSLFFIPVLGSLLRVEFYSKVQQLQGDKLSAYEALYHATLGGAKALDLQDQLGNFNVGKEADFVVLNLKPTALQELRQSKSKSVEDSLFALFTLGDDRNIEATYIYGNRAYQKETAK